MNEMLVYGIIIIAVMAVLGLGIKVSISYKSGSKIKMKNISAQGDVVGRDKVKNDNR